MPTIVDRKARKSMILRIESSNYSLIDPKIEGRAGFGGILLPKLRIG